MYLPLSPVFMCSFSIVTTVSLARLILQKKLVLADTKLPEEFRIALATIVDCDLFTKVTLLIDG
jgi:hypothetical protein